MGCGHRCPEEELEGSTLHPVPLPPRPFAPSHTPRKLRSSVVNSPLGQKEMLGHRCILGHTAPSWGRLHRPVIRKQIYVGLGTGRALRGCALGKVSFWG